MSATPRIDKALDEGFALSKAQGIGFSVAALDHLTKEARKVELECDRLRSGLTWYACGNHIELPGWESCSGESNNWLFPPDSEESWMVDDGGIARSILDGHSINPDEEADEITLPPKEPT